MANEKRTEADCLCGPAFGAAIEAASEANRAGDDHQEQLAAGIVAYCRFMELADSRTLNNVSDSPGARHIAEMYYRDGK